MWRKKYELEGLAKSEELEMANLKLQSRLSDSQNMIEQLSQKLVQNSAGADGVMQMLLMKNHKRI